MSKRPEVIIIDDDRCTLELNKLTVKSVIPEAEIRGFLSARAALEYLRNIDPDDPDTDRTKGIIVSDLHMPVVDGFQFLDEFALLPPVLCNRYTIFILSADARYADAKELTKKPNLAGFFSKPLTIKKFVTLLRKVGYSV
jgi:two-component system, chemotaxis family, chemotaxis protein CheY